MGRAVLGVPSEANSPFFYVQPRFLNGGFDEVIECSPGRRVRHCNWIRFLSSDDPTTRTKRARKSPNVVCRRRRRRPNGGPPVFYYEASEDIPAGSELVASFEAVDGGNCCDAEAFSRSVSEVIMGKSKWSSFK